MSSRYPRSRDVKHHRRGEDRPLAEAIVAVQDGIAFDEIDVTLEERLELPLHGEPIRQAPRHIGGERHEDIHIALGTEIVPYHAAEKPKRSDLPPTAEVAKVHFVVVD